MLTVQKSIKRLKELEAMASVRADMPAGQEKVIRLERERKHLDQNLSASRHAGLPDVLFVIDSNKESIAVKEAGGWDPWWRSSIPTATDEVDYVIPGNDDALRAIRLSPARSRRGGEAARWHRAGFHGR